MALSGQTCYFCGKKLDFGGRINYNNKYSCFYCLYYYLKENHPDSPTIKHLERQL